MNTIAIVINNKAKNAAAAKEFLDGFQGAHIPYKLYETDPDKLVSILKKCVTKYQIILVGGGDGTIRTAAQYCAHTSVILGVLPLGTLNHFSKELALPDNIADIIDSIKHQHTLTIDVAEVNGTIFINNSSIGFYPKFADTRDRYSKIYNKWLSYIPGIIESLKKHKSFTLDIKSKKINCSLHTSFLMISNNLYSYEFPATIKRVGFQKSVLGLYYFKQGKIELFKILKSLFYNSDDFEIHQSKSPIEIHFPNQEEITISLDGDTLKIKTPLIYKIVPKSLNILVKPS